jgi:hypothetical protein
MLRFELAQLRPLDEEALVVFGAGVGSDATASRYVAWVHAFPLLLYRVVAGRRTRPTRAAVLVYEVERAFSLFMIIACQVTAGYLLLFRHAFHVPLLGQPDSWFVVSVLAAWVFVLCVQFAYRAYDRVGKRSSDFALEGEKRPETQLPMLFFNFEKFETSPRGIFLAVGVLGIYFQHAAFQVVILYCAFSRAVPHRRFHSTYTVLIAVLLFHTLLTALARAVAWSELRSVSTKPSSSITPAESTRAFLVSVFINLSFSVLLPLGAMSVWYVIII